MNRFWKIIHDIIQFKALLIEKIVKVLYVLATSFVIIIGFFMLFWFQDYGRYIGVRYYGYMGLVVMILGPIVIRLAYEFLMMSIILVKNTISIKKKLYGEEDSTDPMSAEFPKFRGKVRCPYCGAKKDAGAPFCPKCGNRMPDDADRYTQQQYAQYGQYNAQYAQGAPAQNAQYQDPNQYQNPPSYR